ncbi:MAG: hypothetical protein U0441_38245, partial [Polyangiaceae bacterium]
YLGRPAQLYSFDHLSPALCTIGFGACSMHEPASRQERLKSPRPPPGSGSPSAATTKDQNALVVSWISARDHASRNCSLIFPRFRGHLGRLREWVKRAEADAGKGTPGALTTTEREELGKLRRDVKRLEMEREILKKAAVFFAKENK